MSYRETEVKLPLESASTGHALLQRAGARVQTPRHFEDNLLFDSADQRLQTTGRLLRLRILKQEGGDRAILTFKGPGKISDGVKDREEVECEISHPDHLKRILLELGFEARFRYQKYRTIYHMDPADLELCLDETPIGVFLELEGDIGQIHAHAEKLGFERTRYITDSYVILYLQWCRDHKIEPSNMTFP